MAVRDTKIIARNGNLASEWRIKRLMSVSIIALDEKYMVVPFSTIYVAQDMKKLIKPGEDIYESLSL